MTFRDSIAKGLTDLAALIQDKEAQAKAKAKAKETTRQTTGKAKDLVYRGAIKVADWAKKEREISGGAARKLYTCPKCKEKCAVLIGDVLICVSCTPYEEED